MASPVFTGSQKDAFHRDGFAIVRGLFDADAMGEIGAWTNEIVAMPEVTGKHMVYYEDDLRVHAWLVLFIPLVISSGGNSGSQSAALIITGLARRDIAVGDWRRVLRRGLAMGFLLGGWIKTQFGRTNSLRSGGPNPF